MKRLIQYGRVISRLVGAILILAGLFVAYTWLYQWGPARRTLDPQWMSQHSQQEYWREVQKGIHRGVWLHDDGWTVGVYGDKVWAEWIMNHVKPGTSMGCLGGRPCHSATAMQFLTNQDVGEDADAWLQWWEKNRSKSQENWIVDGFSRRGIKIDLPLTQDEIPIVLALLGDSRTDESDTTPKYKTCNAFRCLRDSGFEPVSFALSNREVPPSVKAGLLEYAKCQRRWPEAMGILPFAKQREDWDNYPLPNLLTLRFQATAYTLIFAPTSIGAVLLLWSFRKRQENQK